MIHFNCFGIKITISYIFILILTVLILIDRTGLVFASFFAVFCHETGHLAAMKLLQVSYTQIDFSLATVRVTASSIIESHKRLLVAISGPLINFLLSVFIISNFEFLKYFGAANLILGFFNMIPATGLDGGDALYAALLAIGTKKPEVIANTVSYISIFAIIILGGYITLVFKANPTLILVGIYLLILSFTKV